MRGAKEIDEKNQKATQSCEKQEHEDGIWPEFK
jgi:hypothetical protein